MTFAIATILSNASVKFWNTVKSFPEAMAVCLLCSMIVVLAVWYQMGTMMGDIKIYFVVLLLEISFGFSLYSLIQYIIRDKSDIVNESPAIPNNNTKNSVSYGAMDQAASPQTIPPIKNGDKFFYEPWSYMHNGICTATWEGEVLLMDGVVDSWRTIRGDKQHLLAGNPVCIRWGRNSDMILPVMLKSNGNISVWHEDNVERIFIRVNN